MPGNKPNVIANGKQLFANGVNQLLVITPGEIGATDRAGEDYITYPRKLGLAVQKNDVAGGMPRTVDDLEGLLAHGDRIAILKPPIGREGLRPREARHLTPFRQFVDPKTVTLFRPFHGYRELLAQDIRCSAVVEVAVCQQNLLHGGTHFGDRRFNPLDITARVHNRRKTRRFTLYD